MTLHTNRHAAACPYCGLRHTAASSERAGSPKDGDLSLCIGCLHWGIFDASAPGGVRRTTPMEAVEIAADPNASRHEIALRGVKQTIRAREITGSKPPFKLKGTDTR